MMRYPKITPSVMFLAWVNECAGVGITGMWRIAWEKNLSEYFSFCNAFS